MIARDNGLSCYRQLSEILTGQIETGAFLPGSQLPTEMALSSRYKLNRHTVRRALQNLEDEGLIYKLRGKGTFVSQNKIPYRISKKTRFTTAILSSGLSPDAKLLKAHELVAGKDLAAKLAVGPTARVLALEILRYVEAVPFAYTASFLSAERFPGLQGLLKGSFSLYGLLKEHYGIDASRTASTFEAALPGSSDMDVLRISPKAPLLIVKSTSKSPAGEIVEYCITRFRGDLCSMTVDFNGEGPRENDGLRDG